MTSLNIDQVARADLINSIVPWRGMKPAGDALSHMYEPRGALLKNNFHTYVHSATERGGWQTASLD